jgi:hypothetical protein
MRLPGASIAFPALRGRPEAETRLMTSVLGELINADAQHLGSANAECLSCKE